MKLGSWAAIATTTIATVLITGLITGLMTGLAEAKCNQRTLNQADHAAFERQLQAMRERVRGFQRYEAAKKAQEKLRLQGAVAVRQKRKLEQAQQQKVAQKFHYSRLKMLRDRHRQFTQAWVEHSRREKQEQEQMACARETYIRARNEFLRKSEKLMQVTEAQDLDASTYWQR